MLRPQPIGIFPLPANLLLLPTPSTPQDVTLAALLSGNSSTPFPPEWLFFSLALHEQYEAAFDSIPDDSLAPYNRFILTGNPELAAAITDPEQRLLAGAALFTMGATEQIPEVGTLTGELAATVQLVRAAALLDQDQLEPAVAELTRAIDNASPVSPLLTAQLLAERAKVHQILGDSHFGYAANDYEFALRFAENTHLPLFAAELHLACGVLYQAIGEKGLIKAYEHYQAAITAGFTLDEAPEAYAWAQHQIGLITLGTPESITALRQALLVYQPQTHPEQHTEIRRALARSLGHGEESNTIYADLLKLEKDPLDLANLQLEAAQAQALSGNTNEALALATTAAQTYRTIQEDELAATALEFAQSLTNTQ